MHDREKIIYGLCKAIGALRVLKIKFPKTEEDVEPGIQACIDAIALLKEQDVYVSVPSSLLVKLCTHIDSVEPMTDEE